MFDRSTMPAIRPDLIPGSSWGASLANLLTKPSWDAIRHPVIRAGGGVCQICGTTGGRAMECHEIWVYAMPPPGEDFVGVQRLIGLAALCKWHHEMFHMGRARMVGNFDAVKTRLMKANGWSEADFESYNADQVRLGFARTDVGRWALDLSLVGGGDPLVIKSGWSEEEGDERFLMRPNPYGGDNYVMVLGAAYIIYGKTVSAQDPEPAADGLSPEEGDFEFVRSMGNGVNAEIATPRSVARRTRQPPVPVRGWPSPDAPQVRDSGDGEASYLEEFLADSRRDPEFSNLIEQPAPDPVWTLSIPPVPAVKLEGRLRRWWRR